MINRLTQNKLFGLYNLYASKIQFDFSEVPKFDSRKNYYEALGLSKDASDGDIKKAYYRLAKTYHPDVSKGNEQKFKNVNEAYQILSDEKIKKQYDAARSDPTQSYKSQYQNPQNQSYQNPYTHNNDDFNRNFEQQWEAFKRQQEEMNRQSMRYGRRGRWTKMNGRMYSQSQKDDDYNSQQYQKFQAEMQRRMRFFIIASFMFIFFMSFFNARQTQRKYPPQPHPSNYVYQGYDAEDLERGLIQTRNGNTVYVDHRNSNRIY